MTEPYPAFEELLPFLLQFIGTDVIAAHNAPFDLGFLLKYCEGMGIEYSPRALCTLAISRRLYPDLPDHRLGTVAEFLGVSEGCYHRALGDAMATARMLSKMIEYMTEDK
jgi:DNA polymerase III epsilon subunit-like protein